MQKIEPKQERAQRTYNAILDCVERLILTNSSEKLTPRAVVLETGIPQGTLYRYFADVAEMRDALFERYMTRFQEELPAAYDEINPANVVEAMVALFDQVLAYNRANPVLLELSLDPITQHRLRAVAYQRELIAGNIAEALVRKGIISRYDKPFLDELYLCVLISASLTKEAFLWDSDGDSYVIEAGREIVRRQAERLLAKLASEGSGGNLPDRKGRKIKARPIDGLDRLKNYRRTLKGRR